MRAAGDESEVGAVIESTGVYELWSRKGATRLFAANEFLTPEIVASYPRLALLCSAVLRMSLKVEAAEALYESVKRTTEGLTRDREGGDSKALAVDGVFVRAVMAGGSMLALGGDLDSLLPAPAAEDGEARGRFLLGARHLVLCGSSHERARFEDCRRHAAVARAHFGEDKLFGNIVLDLYVGMAAMAEGRLGVAESCYANARRATRRHFASDPCLAVSVDAVTIELALKRDRQRIVDRRMLDNLANLRAIWSEIDMAAIANGAELTFRQHGSGAAIELLTKAVDDVQVLRSQALSRHVAALLVSYLAESERADEAASVWSEHRLPEHVAELLDVSAQPWRTMESMACARIRLLAGQGDFAAAEDLAGKLCVTASERGLLRSALRGVAILVALAAQMGDDDRAVERLLDFLRLVGGSEYAGPLARNRQVSFGLLERLLASELDAATRATAESMRNRLEAPKPNLPSFSPRELQVLAEVSQGRRNREIADHLGISQPGVRFHLGNIYRKTGVNRRDEAVRRARALGVLD